MGPHPCFIVDPKAQTARVAASSIADAEYGVVPLTLHEYEFLHIGFKSLVPDSPGLLWPVGSLLEEPNGALPLIPKGRLHVGFSIDVSR